jgi:hypothetical protein
VFVRKAGRTVPTDAKDLDALQARLRTGPTPAGELQVGLVGNVPISWIDAPAVPDVIRRWVAQDRAEMVAAAEEIERRRRRQPSSSRGAGMVDVTGIQGIVEAYRVEVLLGSFRASALRVACFSEGAGPFLEEAAEFFALAGGVGAELLKLAGGVFPDAAASSLSAWTRASATAARCPACWASWRRLTAHL